ncbi:MAG: plasmid pRiA4b ORF-3 family protein [Clostridiales bacterium]|nr:plasmid pRiA4b ORF-3 family protein [Clostridiales bacterium]
MNQDRLYDAAFAFKAMNLWDSLSDDQIFAIQAEDKICYINITGLLGEHYSLGVYPGQEGIDSLHRIYQMASVSENEKMAAFLGQLSLFCEFVPKDELDPESAEKLSPYIKAHGMSMRSKKALWPQFFHCRPYRVAAYTFDDAEMATITEALEAACWLNGNLGRPMHTLAHLYESEKTIPLLHREGDTWRIEKIPMPPEPDISYPIGHTFNEMYEARVQNLKQKGTWACELRLYQFPCEAEGTEEKVFPWELLTVDMDTGREIPIQRVRDYETRTEVMLDKIMEAMFRANVCPKAFCVHDERTYALLEDWSAEMNIELSMEEEIPEELEELENITDTQAFWGTEDSMDAMEGMLDFLLLLPDKDLFSDQPELEEYITTFREMLDHPETPDNIRSKASEILERYEHYQSRQRPGTGRGRKSKSKNISRPGKSLVISVSLDTGCYRHIRISDQALLEDLSLAILNAFDFDNDHLHCFFMDNRAFSPWDVYYSRDCEDTPATDQFTLAEAGMTVGKKFKYLFDFGDSWLFQCRVLQQSDEDTPAPRIVRRKGDAPPQYPEV